MSYAVNPLGPATGFQFALILAALSTVERRKDAFRDFLPPQQNPNSPFLSSLLSQRRCASHLLGGVT